MESGYFELNLLLIYKFLANIEAEASLLIPIPYPYGGLVIVGRESISYHKVLKKF